MSINTILYRQEIDIQRRLQRIECVITNFVPTVDVVAVAQRAAAIITTANPSFALEVVSGNFNCNSPILVYFIGILYS